MNGLFQDVSFKGGCDPGARDMLTTYIPPLLVPPDEGYEEPLGPVFALSHFL